MRDEMKTKSIPSFVSTATVAIISPEIPNRHDTNAQWQS